MSQMTEAIDRIAICAEKNRYKSILEFHLQCSQYHSKDTLDKFTPEEIQLITLENKPRLNNTEIEEILQDYTFELPKEFYDLYQRGNGNGLPIGLNRDYDTHLNYCSFPDPDFYWYDLEDAMRTYRAIQESENIDKKLFPIFGNELCVYTVMGNEKIEQKSHVYSLSNDDIPSVVNLAASSLTSLLLACAERMEMGYSNISNKHIKYIMDKYEIYDESLLLGLSCF